MDLSFRVRRHEDPVTGELANQNIKDRFYGVNDPVAKKMLREHDVRSCCRFLSFVTVLIAQHLVGFINVQ